MELDTWKKDTWQQFGAAVDTLENSISACPDDLWGDQSKFHQYWYVAYHTIFWLDYYMTFETENFTPPEPFTMSEMDPEGLLPDRVYSKGELLTYLEHGRKKSKKAIAEFTDEIAAKQFKFGRVDISYGELLLYVMRHLQHHAAQLNLILRQETDSAPGWVFKAKG